MRVSRESVTAALKIFREEFELPESANVKNYIWEGQTTEQREMGLQRLKIADETAEQKTYNVVEKAIQAAIGELMSDDEDFVSWPHAGHDYLVAVMCNKCGSLVPDNEIPRSIHILFHEKESN